MKKTAVLLAGLLLVTGTVFAESKFDLGGSVEWNTTVINSESKAVFKDGSNGDTDATLKLTYMADENTKVVFGLNTDDDGSSDADETMDINIYQTRGDIEVGFDLAVTDDATSKGTYLLEDTDSNKTFIKWNMAEGTAVTVYPFNMGMASSAGEFDEGDGYLEIPGIVYTMGDMYVGAGIDAVTGMKSGEGENVVGIKAGYKMASDAMTVNIDYSGAFYDEKEVATTNYTSRDLREISQSLMAKVNMPLSDVLTFDAEAGFNSLAAEQVIGTDKTEGGFGIWGQVTMAMSETMKPYAEAKYATDGFYALEAMRDFNMAKTETGGLLAADLGVKITLTEGLVFKPEFSMATAGEKIYADEKGVAGKEKTKYDISLELTYSL